MQLTRRRTRKKTTGFLERGRAAYYIVPLLRFETTPPQNRENKAHKAFLDAYRLRRVDQYDFDNSRGLKDNESLWPDSKSF